MGFVNRSFAAAGVGFAVAALAGCASSNGTLLSSGDANQLTSQLQRISTDLSNQDCQLAANHLADLHNEVSSLTGINATLLSNLNQGVQTTESLAETECPTGAAATTTTTSTTVTTKTTPTVTTTTTTVTVPTTTTSTGSSTSTTGGAGITTGASSSTTTTPINTVTAPPTGGTGLPGAGAPGAP
jgi:hypothetical protein